MKNIISPKFDTFLVTFPIWIPIIYWILIQNFPAYDLFFFVGVMLLLGEPHFGSTWLFFIDKNHSKWMKDHKFQIIYGPIFLILLFLIIFYFNQSLALFLVLLFNFYHVTRQSIGVSKIYSTYNTTSKELATFTIYITSIFCIVIGLMRFILNINISNSLLFYLNIAFFFISTFFLLLILSYKNKEKFSLNFYLSIITGVLMFYPLLIVDKIQHAFAMGVGMHYAQYLCFTVPIFYRRAKENKIEAHIFFKKVLKNINLIFFYLIIYGCIMVSLTFNDQLFGPKSSLPLYVIPVIFQLLHFYIDMYIWRFSDKHLRENMLPFLLKSNG